MSLVVTVGALVLWGAGDAAALPTWQAASTLSLGTDGVGIDCVATTCWSLEAGRLLSSSDDGQTWADRTDLLPPTVAALDDVDCVRATLCYLAATDSAGAGSLLVLDQGEITSYAIPGSPELTSISCASVGHCAGVTGTSSFVTEDGGVSWSVGSMPRTFLGRPRVDCVPKSKTCFVIGNYGLVPVVARSVDQGRNWTMQSLPWNDGGIYDIDCPTTTDCFATGADFSDDAVVVRTANGGASWAFAQVPFHAYAPRSVSCVSATTCIAVGHSPGNTAFVFATSDAQHWTSQTITPVPTDQPGQISCVSATACAIVASGAGFATVDGGATWPQVSVPAGLEAPSSLTCFTASRCIGLGADSAGTPAVITTGNFGSTWSRSTFPTDAGRPSAVSCPATTLCYALSITPLPGTNRNRTHVLTSTDKGQTWTAGATIPVALGDLTCPSTTTCLAAGYNGRSEVQVYRMTDGTHWSLITPPATTTLLGIVCTSVTSCVFVSGTYGGDWTAYTSDDLGTTYQPHTVPTKDWYSFDCSGSFCMIAGSDGGSGAIATSPDAGVTWNLATVPPQAELISDVSCGSDTACGASTYDFDFDHGGPRIVGTHDGGATWTLHAVPARHEAPIAVECVGAKCMGSDYSDAANPVIVVGRI